MTLSTTAMTLKHRNPTKVHIFSFMSIVFITLLGISSCSSSDTDANATNTAGPQSLTTTLPHQEPVTLPQGHPQKLIPIMENTTLRSSTFNKDQGSASLIFESTAEPEQIFKFYSDNFITLGFSKVPGDAKLDKSIREFQRHDAKETASIAITTNSDKKPVATVSVNEVSADDFK